MGGEQEDIGWGEMSVGLDQGLVNRALVGCEAFSLVGAEDSDELMCADYESDGQNGGHGDLITPIKRTRLL